ncbi:hypothetical protein ACTVZO_14230 [Streptomyces sp. IBSNAI002]|uniref:hypothetical protein n=1 Tax=Streptomyces sp. IBSNAI002 TaxID=3457500 RepID=UPI003FD1000D
MDVTSGARVWLRQADDTPVRDRTDAAAAFEVIETTTGATGPVCLLTAHDPLINALYAGWHPLARLIRT